MDSCPEDLDGDGLVTVSDLLQLLGSFGEACEVSVVEFTCGNPLSYHGYDYGTVQIGEQCWFTENLKAQFYANGDEILGDLTSEQWSNTQSGAQTVYGGSIDFYELYGRLYNGYAVLDSRGLCPPAWNVPSDDEWKELEIEIGMSVIEADEIGWRGSDEGHKLKSNYGWSGLDGDGNGIDSFSFEGLPGGQVYASDGNTYGAPSSGIWWSSSLSAESTLWYRYLRYSNMRVLRDLDGTVNGGMSVRCVKGSE